MSTTEQQYQRVYNEWITARKSYKRTLNNLGKKLKYGLISADNPEFIRQFNNAYNVYQPVAKRYLKALKDYTREQPKLTGRLMFDFMQEASIAQQHHRTDVSDSLIKSAEKMAVESAKTAHADWSKNGNEETMAAVFVTITDAQMLSVDTNPEVKKIAKEVFIHYEKGKVKRDPTIQSVKVVDKLQTGNEDSITPPVKSTPKVPPAKRRPGPSLWIEKTIPRKH